MRRTYKPKVKLYTELLIESEIYKGGKGATTSAAAKSTIFQHLYFDGK